MLKVFSDGLYATALHIICCQWLFVPTLQCPQLQLHWQCTIMVSITENIIKGSCWTHVECMLITWLCCFVQWNQNSKCWPCSCLHIQIPSTCDIIINLTGTFVHTVHTPTHTYTHASQYQSTKVLMPKRCWSKIAWGSANWMHYHANMAAATVSRV